MPVFTLSRAAPGSRLGRLDWLGYHPELTAAVREVPGREWNKSYMVWLVPLVPDSILMLKERAAAIGWLLDIPEQALRDDLNRAYARQREAHKVREAGDSEIAFDFKTEPYAHQRAGLAFLAHLGGGALLWEMGLGKTKTAIDYCEYLAARRGLDDATTPLQFTPGLKVLVIAPNTVKRNWRAEVMKHAGHDDVVVPTGTVEKRLTQLATARYTIVNCELLSIGKAAIALQKVPWDVVIVDESTRFKTPEAARTKALMRIRPKHRLILTGTPITGNPQDAYAQFEWVAPGTFGNSFWAFKERYLAKDFFGNITGIKPGMTDELRKRIDGHAYRILKEQVLDLPPKVYIDRTVEMEGEQKRAYQQMKDELRIEIEGRPDLTANNILTMLLRLTQVTAGFVGEKGAERWLGGAKQTELIQLVNDELRGEQVVIFGLYQFELEQLWLQVAPPSTGLDKWDQPPIIYGPTPEKRRAELVDQFQAGDRRVLFCQTRTGGIGINLTKAQTAIYVTRGWSLEEYLQSQDRLHRIGQTGTVSIVHLVAEGSIDQEIAAALADKKNTADDLTGDTARSLAARLLEK